MLLKKNHRVDRFTKCYQEIAFYFHLFYVFLQLFKVIFNLFLGICTANTGYFHLFSCFFTANSGDKDLYSMLQEYMIENEALRYLMKFYRYSLKKTTCFIDLKNA
jgi:hypothetical protein